jgi:hypothetical protein
VVVPEKVEAVPPRVTVFICVASRVWSVLLAASLSLSSGTSPSTVVSSLLPPPLLVSL